MRILHQFLQQPSTAAANSAQNTSLQPLKPERHHRHSMPPNTTTIITTPATPPAAMVNAPVEVGSNITKPLTSTTTTTTPTITTNSQIMTSKTTTTSSLVTTTSSTTATAITSTNTGTTDRRLADIHRKLATLATARSTPESSQTDSDDFSPQIARKRKGVCARDILPRFSISIEDETISGGSSSAENTREQSPLALPHQKSMDGHIGVKNHRSSRSSIVKSASALGLSLMSSGSKLKREIVLFSGRFISCLFLFS